MIFKIKQMRWIVVLMAVLLTACSFHPRGQAGMPFETIYLDATNPNTPFIKELRRNLEANKVNLANTAEHADVILNIVSESQSQQILALSVNGLVNEFQLFYRISIRAYDLKQQEWIPAEEFVIHRNYSYDNNNVLAMEAEVTMLYQSMRSDMVQQIVRRLSRASPQPN